jgi:hypothetical protein
MTENDWIIRIGAQEYRAPNIETVREWVETDRVPRTAFVCDPITRNWRPVSDMPELSQAIAFASDTQVPSTSQPSQTAKPSSGCSTGCVVGGSLLALVLLVGLCFGVVSNEKSADSSGSSARALSPSSEWRPALAHLWTGVKLYDSQSKQVVFEVLGGNEKYLAPDGRRIRGLKVKYPDGTVEWKDRDWIVDSGEFLVRADDPALQRKAWEIYEY